MLQHKNLIQCLSSVGVLFWFNGLCQSDVFSKLISEKQIWYSLVWFLLTVSFLPSSFIVYALIQSHSESNFK